MIEVGGKMLSFVSFNYKIFLKHVNVLLCKKLNVNNNKTNQSHAELGD